MFTARRLKWLRNTSPLTFILLFGPRLFEVTLTIPLPQAGQRVSLPAWIPGSYLVREDSPGVRRITAYVVPEEGAVLEPDPLEPGKTLLVVGHDLAPVDAKRDLHRALRRPEPPGVARRPSTPRRTRPGT